MNKNQFQRLAIIHNNLITGRRFTGKELLGIIKKTLEHDERSVSLRTLKSDIEMLRDTFQAPIEEGKYVYTEPYSFLNILNLNDLAILEELKAILSKVSTLNRIDSFLKNDFLKLTIQINQLNGTDNKVVYFETNDSYLGQKYLLDLFDFILKKQPIVFYYQKFEEEPKEMIVHPYILKEYNERWYLYGWNHSSKQIEQFGLERILGSIKVKSHLSFRENTTFDPNDYFSAMVGITRFPDNVIQKIKIRVYGKSINYVRTKPLHNSQTPVYENSNSEKYVEFEYFLINNYEFRSKILALGANVEVLEPATIRDELKLEIQNMAVRYS